MSEKERWRDYGKQLWIPFVCTNKGGHRRVELGRALRSGKTLSIFNRRSRNSSVEGRRLTGGGTRALRKVKGMAVVRPMVDMRGPRSGPGYLYQGYELNCPKCPRTPQLSEETLLLLRRYIDESGNGEVDISRLPF